MIESVPELSPTAIAAVAELVGAATRVDGFSALNEEESLRLRRSGPNTTHLLAGPSETPLGYAQLHQAEHGRGHAALVVHPDHRRQGIGTQLLKELLSTASRRGLEIWATRHTAGARALASKLGLVPVREMLIMTRSLAEPLPATEPPPGVRIRAFVPGQDEPSWLEVNARAFAAHPEQGHLTRADLDERMSESWFDPAGFFVAVPEDTEQILGFHWTKQHADGLGEVYVLGVDPQTGVRGLGRTLLAAGLEHLRATGNDRVHLYTEADNMRAVDLYHRFGFEIASRDVMYVSPNGVDKLATILVSSDAPQI
jgi:mycothiol synthase